MSISIGERGLRHAAERLIGRGQELEYLDQRRLRGDSIYVTFVHGIAGVGKSSLLAACLAVLFDHRGGVIVQTQDFRVR